MKKFPAICGILSVILWTYILSYSDSFFLIYVICALISCAGAITYLRSDRSVIFDKENKASSLIIIFSAVVFSGAVSLANYAIFWEQKDLRGFYPRHMDIGIPSSVGFLMMFLTGVIVFYFVFYLIGSHVEKIGYKCDRSPVRYGEPVSDEIKKGIRKVFFAAFSAAMALPLFFLYFVSRPGVITPDTVWQLMMIEGGGYSRHHPYYHTRIIGFFVWLSKVMGSDRNTGILIYTTCQILFLSVVIGYAAVTLYEKGIAKKWIVITMLIYALNPYFIISAAGVQKDFLHSACILVFMISVYRYLYQIGTNRTADAVITVVSAVGVAIFRNNGWVILAATVIIFAVKLKGQMKKLYPAFLVVLALAFLMNHQVLDALGVLKTNAAEPYSVPLQQMARVAATGRQLSEEDLHDLNLYMQVNAVGDNYLPYLSDPVKEMLVVSNFEGHLPEFLGLWARLGIKYPMDYIKAYSDLTKGFYNGGYDHLWKWERGVNSNDLGYEEGWSLPAAVSAWDLYTSLFDGYSPLRLFRSVGLYVWALYILWLILRLKKDDKRGVILTPLFILVATILVSTPLCYQIRYVHAVVYGIFMLYPMLLAGSE